MTDAPPASERGALGEQALLSETSLRLVVPGRRTGRPHAVTVWFAYGDGILHFLAHRRDHGLGTDWYRNLVAAGRATVRAGGRTHRILHEPFPPGVDPLAVVVRLFEAKYGAPAVDEWYRPTRRIPVRARLLPAGRDDRV